MAEINANVAVSNPRALFNDSQSFKVLANGRVYIGQIDTDPTDLPPELDATFS